MIGWAYLNIGGFIGRYMAKTKDGKLVNNRPAVFVFSDGNMVEFEFKRSSEWIDGYPVFVAHKVKFTPGGEDDSPSPSDT
jgi:hypothetical protein